jgi:hypothetical protein
MLTIACHGSAVPRKRARCRYGTRRSFALDPTGRAAIRRDRLPCEPGVYAFVDRGVAYIGHTAEGTLDRRVRSYLLKKYHAHRTVTPVNEVPPSREFAATRGWEKWPASSGTGHAGDGVVSKPGGNLIGGCGPTRLG